LVVSPFRDERALREARRKQAPRRKSEIINLNN
jgi:hypothetical protein